MAYKTEVISQAGVREIPTNFRSSNEVTTVQPGLIIIPVAFVTTLAFILFKQVKYRQNLYTQLVNLKPFSSVPCRKCLFFFSNQHLPCAVQPALVLSLESVNCNDYTPKKK